MTLKDYPPGNEWFTKLGGWPRTNKGGRWWKLSNLEYSGTSLF